MMSDPTPTHDALAIEHFAAELEQFHSLADLGWCGDD